MLLLDIEVGETSIDGYTENWTLRTNVGWLRIDPSGFGRLEVAPRDKASVLPASLKGIKIIEARRASPGFILRLSNDFLVVFDLVYDPASERSDAQLDIQSPIDWLEWQQEYFSYPLVPM